MEAYPVRRQSPGRGPDRLHPRRHVSGTGAAEALGHARQVHHIHGLPREVATVDGAQVVLPADLAGLFEIRDRAWIRVIGLRVVNARPDPNSNGIFVGGSHDIVLERDRTADTQSSGIGVWLSRDVEIRRNVVVRATLSGMQEAISVAGTDTFLVEGNRVHDTGGGKEGICAKDGSTNGAIRGNVVHHVPAVGIYVDAWDKATSGIEVDGNIVHDIAKYTGIAVASEMGGLLSDVRIVNNVVYASEAFGIAVTRNGVTDRAHPMARITIINNTVWHNGGAWGGGIAIDDPAATGVVVRNNIVSDNRSFQLSLSADVPPAEVSVDHNLVDGYRGDLEDGEITGEASVVGDPRFVDAPDHDFHLQAGSPAVDAGSADGAPSTDFGGQGRPSGAGYDIGAFEYVGGAD